jgi:hypothetical protein
MENNSRLVFLDARDIPSGKNFMKLNGRLEGKPTYAYIEVTSEEALNSVSDDSFKDQLRKELTPLFAKELNKHIKSKAVSNSIVDQISSHGVSQKIIDQLRRIK